ncbi:hypothetical protein QTN47_26675 [Danxiaibacter flavus]|uniref:DUF4878 domain-containing protein n=1 Tax=Danxiaibacter flavus TaxID=3049108 RepID=A0ABV3ZMM0_9BACT|nr:hypothetical protein QNM32_26675 [Chitinophagaceae bacterium DXS]
MKMLLVILSFIFIGLISCSGGKTNFTKAENAFDAGREFIDGCLKGDFEKAAFYMKPDATNKESLEKLEVEFNRKSQEEKKHFEDASIVILDDETVDERTHIINYKNSYDNIARKIKVVLTDAGWLVDLKYTFNGNL